ncbi:hypothetical protein RO3G_12742 [Rhizopus delemar RA 99-880]|uniref:Uncharacterized protein n=1 Tax=Rhizopus delemar (strain RA 99-880 / ATCC MYA-4621 / FGSC 9543 / NRRL 43880) TaxID=246409 RepID=I1CHV1_RHIO9|nr:hypothetical protein RO3G_12742 [Rhizopus delemar RA 99-880]|eukprot:EIE88031.1 hypothetical protein RO3G_12742 [Rhizopus delemar RA 99-880]
MVSISAFKCILVFAAACSKSFVASLYELGGFF